MQYLPVLDVMYKAKPISPEIIQIQLLIKVQCQFNTYWHNAKETFQILVVSNNKLIYQQSFAYNMLKCNNSSLQDQPYSEHNNFTNQTFCLPLKKDIDEYTIKIISQSMIDVDAYLSIDLRGIIVKSAEDH